MARRVSTMGLRTRHFGPMTQDPRNPNRYTSDERLVIEGRYTREDVNGIRQLTVQAANVRGAAGTYRWINARVGAWGSGGSNPNQLVILATLEYDQSVPPPPSPAPPKPSPTPPVSSEPLIGDLDVTIQWPDLAGDDPYGLLKLTSMLYPLP